jgi:DNA-binding transcriptional ArsR family regulator
VDVVQVIADPKRREILRLVWDAERPAAEIAEHFDVTFGAVSQHLGILRQAGLVVVRRDGTRRFYRADRVALRPYTAMLRMLWAEQLDRLAGLAESSELAESAGSADLTGSAELAEHAGSAELAGKQEELAEPEERE